MIEKLGHKKRLQTMRRQWIDEGKPHRQQNHEQDTEPEASEEARTNNATETRTDALPVSVERPRTPPQGEHQDDDLYSATPQAVLNQRRKEREAAAEESLFLTDEDAEDGATPSEDELDALLAEDTLKDLNPAAVNAQQARTDVKRSLADNFDDEEEAMAGMDDMW